MNAPTPGSAEWHKEQIAAYAKEFPIYKEYAGTLEKILKQICKIHAPTAIVQVRPKGVSNFAEKALRKWRAGEPDGRDPVNLFPDLCGARVITNTQEQVDAMAAFIRKHFEIDEDNSQDTSVRLQPAEFGYRSVHLIVQVKDAEILGIALSKVIGGRKAEIQVRTVVQHAWAEVSHDLIYKSAFTVPEELKRDCNRIAALLENADKAFGQLVRDLEHYRLDHGAYLTSEQMAAEIETLKTIFENEPDAENRPKIALRIGRIACAAGNWQEVADTLLPYENTNHLLRPEILARLGHALCRLNAGKPGAAEFKHGQKCLQKVGRPTDVAGKQADRVRAQALAHLAWSYSLLDRELGKAQSLYHLSYLCDPDNPFHLLGYVDANLLFKSNTEFLPALQPVLLDAAEKCRRHVEVRVELPWAYLALGRFLLLLGQQNESLAAYAKAVHCAHHTTELKEALEMTRKLIGRLGDELPGLELVERLMTLGIIAKTYETRLKAREFFSKAEIELKKSKQQKPANPEEIKTATKNWSDAKIKFDDTSKTLQDLLENSLTTTDWPSQGKDHLKSPIVIIAGGTRENFQTAAQKYDELLREALRGFRGTIISGGTTAGICGVVGQVKRALVADGDGQFELLGYLPEGELPPDAKEDKAYVNIRTGRNGFSAWQPMQNWIDVLAAGIDPGEVRLLNINGGEIAALECRFALAMGATVGVVADSGRESARLLPDADWKDAERLLRLPQDRMTLRAFVNSGKPATQLTGEQLEAAGRAVHENYRQTNVSVLAESGMQRWEDLREDFKNSNCQQAAYAGQILRACGFGVHSKTSGSKAVTFTNKEIELMAEMEHGRWNAERLQSGWRYNSVKDAKKKLSPYLAPWSNIPESIKKYDYDAVRRFPEILAAAGLAVYRLEKRNPDKTTPQKKSPTQRKK